MKIWGCSNTAAIGTHGRKDSPERWKPLNRVRATCNRHMVPLHKTLPYAFFCDWPVWYFVSGAPYVPLMCMVKWLHCCCPYTVVTCGKTCLVLFTAVSAALKLDRPYIRTKSRSLVQHTLTRSARSSRKSPPTRSSAVCGSARKARAGRTTPGQGRPRPARREWR